MSAHGGQAADPRWLRRLDGVSGWSRARSAAWAREAEYEIARRRDSSPRRLRRQLRDLETIARYYERAVGDPIVARDLERARQAIEDRLARIGHLSEGHGEQMAAPRRPSRRPAAPARARAPRTAPLQPGRSPLGQYGIDRYGTFRNRPRDRLQGHELLQNLWLEVHGHGRRMARPASRNNPAVAVSHREHVEIGRRQRALGLFNRARLSGMTAAQIVDANALAMRQAGVQPDVIEVLRREALAHAATLPVAPARRTR